MEALKLGWDFFQKEVLGMQWLNRLMGSLVEAVGLDPASRIGGSIQFFFYDVIKIAECACSGYCTQKSCCRLFICDFCNIISSNRKVLLQ